MQAKSNHCVGSLSNSLSDDIVIQVVDCRPCCTEFELFIRWRTFHFVDLRFVKRVSFFLFHFVDPFIHLQVVQPHFWHVSFSPQLFLGLRRCQFALFHRRSWEMLSVALSLVGVWDACYAFWDCLVVVLDCLAFRGVLEKVVHSTFGFTWDRSLVRHRLMSVWHSHYLVLTLVDNEISSLSIVLGWSSISRSSSFLLSLCDFQVRFWHSLTTLRVDFRSVRDEIGKRQLRCSCFCESAVKLCPSLIKFLNLICNSRASQVTVIFLILELLFGLLNLAAVSLGPCCTNWRNELAFKSSLSFDCLPSYDAHLLRIWIRLGLSHTSQIIRRLTPRYASRLRGSVILLTNQITYANWGTQIHHVLHLRLDRLILDVRLSLRKHPLLRFWCHLHNCSVTQILP